jgi:hypothetical protein
MRLAPLSLQAWSGIFSLIEASEYSGKFGEMLVT